MAMTAKKGQKGSVMLEYFVVLFFSAGMFYLGLVTLARPSAQAHSEHFIQQMKLPH